MFSELETSKIAPGEAPGAILSLFIVVQRRVFRLFLDGVVSDLPKVLQTSIIMWFRESRPFLEGFF